MAANVMQEIRENTRAGSTGRYFSTFETLSAAGHPNLAANVLLIMAGNITNGNSAGRHSALKDTIATFAMVRGLCKTPVAEMSMKPASEAIECGMKLFSTQELQAIQLAKSQLRPN